MAIHENAPTQLVVLGRGLEANGQPNAATTSLGVFAARYCVSHPEITDVAFSGGRPAVATELGQPEDGEGNHMLNIANAVGMPAGVRTTTENGSFTTVHNFVNLVSGVANGEQLIDPDQKTLVVAAPEHLPRAMWCARLVMPQTTFVPAEISIPTPTAKQVAMEKILFGISRALFAGVRPGNVYEIGRRDAWFVRQTTRLGAVKSLGKLLHPAFRNQQSNG